MKFNDNFLKKLDFLEEYYCEIRETVSSFEERRGEELTTRLQEEIEKNEPERVRLMAELYDICADFNSDEKAVHQNYIKQTRFFEHFQEAPFNWRIINKPNGYAGDAEMMRIIYRNDFEGDTTFGKYLHKNAVSTDACQAVRNRKEFLIHQIKQVKKGKILSFAAGPISEIKEILRNGHNGECDFLACDHDISILRQVNGSIRHPKLQYSIVNAFNVIKGDLRIATPKGWLASYCNPQADFKGFKKILCTLKYSFDSLKHNEYDLVYSAGLYDYIKTFEDDDQKGAVALTANLFKLVKPGGALIIGNFSHENPDDLVFVMEYIYDWQLIYRNKDEILRFARSIPQDQIKTIEVLQEPLGINYFLKIEKK